MASVFTVRTPKGTISYKAIWNEPGLDGKRRQRTRNFKRAADARAYAGRMEQEVERRNVGDPRQHSTEQFLRGWLARLKDRGELSPTTIAGYSRHIDLASRIIGHVPLARLSAQDLDTAYGKLLKSGGRARRNSRGNTESRSLTSRTVLHVHRCLHTAFEQARRWKLIPENPARDATPPSPERSRVRAFTADEVARLFDVAAKIDHELFVVVACMLAGGLRRSEVLGLCFDAIDLEKGTISILRTVVEVDHTPLLRERAKTSSSLRMLKIPDELVELLRQQRVSIQERTLVWGRSYRREPLFCFPGPGGEPMLPQRLTDRLRALMERARITDAHSPCHAWRHTAGTLLYGATQNVKTVQHRLGHSTPAITMSLYVHPVEEEDQVAAEHFGAMIKRREQ